MPMLVRAASIEPRKKIANNPTAYISLLVIFSAFQINKLKEPGKLNGFNNNKKNTTKEA